MRIQTATIQRLRDALLKSGQRTSLVFSPAHKILAREGLLGEAESEAIDQVDPMAETMFLMMAADGQVTDEERDAIRGALRGLADGLLHDGTIDAMLERYGDALARDGREARLKHLAGSLADEPGTAENAFALAAAVALADGRVTPEETAFIKQLAQWYRITPERASVILDQVEEERSTD
jgi:tellurite resistance protein